MVDPLRETLEERATVFRRGLEATNRRDRPRKLQDFPVDCCLHACNLLGIFLLDGGFGSSEKIAGRRDDKPNREHIWLVHQGYILDITADQFCGEGQQQCIVTLDSPWHRTWESLTKRNEGFIIDDDSSKAIRAYYRDFYPMVLKNCK
jgi:hypothetical protein